MEKKDVVFFSADEFRTVRGVSKFLTRRSLKHEEIYVKCFTDEDGNRIDPNSTKEKVFFVIITNLSISGFFKVRGAKKLSEGKWELTCLDRKKEILPQEPEKIRELYGATLYHMDRSWYIPVEENGSFSDVKDLIEKERWHLKKEMKDGITFRSSAIVKLWQEGDKHHAVTESGTHYIF